MLLDPPWLEIVIVLDVVVVVDVVVAVDVVLDKVLDDVVVEVVVVMLNVAGVVVVMLNVAGVVGVMLNIARVVLDVVVVDMWSIVRNGLVYSVIEGFVDNRPLEVKGRWTQCR